MDDNNGVQGACWKICPGSGCVHTCPGGGVSKLDHAGMCSQIGRLVFNICLGRKGGRGFGRFITDACPGVV